VVPHMSPLQGQEEALGLSVQLSDAKQQVAQLTAALEQARAHLQAQQTALAQASVLPVMPQLVEQAGHVLHACLGKCLYSLALIRFTQCCLPCPCNLSRAACVRVCVALPLSFLSAAAGGQTGAAAAG